MKTGFVILLSFLILSVQSQDKIKKSFENLSTITIGMTGEDLIESISYDKSIAEVINKRYQDLDKSDPFYMEECDGAYIKLIRTKINRQSDKYYVVSYNPDCCCAYGFTIYEDENPDVIVGEIIADRMFVPGNGAIYTDGRKWKKFNERKKYILKNDSIIEVEQPFNYVGLKSKANSVVNIYSDKMLKTHIATIPKDYEIEVILKDPDFDELYLVRTSFGMIGWAKLRAYQYEARDVEGLYYWGD